MVVVVNEAMGNERRKMTGHERSEERRKRSRRMVMEKARIRE